MVYLLSLLSGMMISVMVVFNGGLNVRAGQAMALVIIHMTGLAFVALVMGIGKNKPRFPRLPLWMYTGGFVGILTTVFNNTAFGHISVSAMMALSLLGESVSGLLADHFGLLGLPVRRFRPSKLWGALLPLAGIAWMLNDFKLVPVVVSLLAGGTVLFSRLLNGCLTRASSPGTSTFANYLTGLSGALILLALSGGGTVWASALNGPFHTYLGGILGAVIVLLSNVIVGKISTFYMSLAFFVGQVLSGLLLDTLLAGTFSAPNLMGGLLVLVGLLVNLLQDRAMAAKSVQPASAVQSAECKLQH